MHDALLGRRSKVPIRKGAVLDMVAKGVIMNCCGLGCTLVAMQVSYCAAQALVAQLLLQPLTLPDAKH